MKFRNRIALILFAALISNAMPLLAAQGFINAASGFYNSYETDTNMESSGAGVGVQHFFSPVLYGDYPYAAAAFMDRQPSVQASLYYYEMNQPDVKLDGSDNYSFAVNLADNVIPITFGVTYAKSQLNGKFNNTASISSSQELLEFEIGYYINRGQRLKIGFGAINDGIQIDDGKQHSDSSIYEINYTSLRGLGEGKYIVPRVQYTSIVSNDIQGSKELGIGLGYYFSRAFDVSLGVSKISSGVNEDINGYTLASEYFITPMIFTGVEYSQSTTSETKLDSDEVSLYVTGRF